MHETFIDANGLPLCLCSWEPVDGPVVLCLHGILDQGACWQPVARPLVRQGYRVIAPDFRGHGRSGHVGTACSYRLLDFVSDADAVLRSLKATQVILAGHSLGAIVAAQLAAARPERISRLVVVEPPMRNGKLPSGQQQLVNYLDYAAQAPVHPTLDDVAAAADRLRQGEPAMSRDLAQALARRCTKKTSDGVTWSWDARLRTRSSLTASEDPLNVESYCSLLASLTMPVTLVRGTSGMVGSEEQAQGIARHATQHVVIRGGHNLTIEAPDQVAASIIGQVEATKPGAARQERRDVLQG